MNDQQLLRYSRHILLDDLGIEGQEKLLAAHALILGAGGLGSPAALYLASAGVGHLTIIDDDAVDLTNLQRQIIHAEASVGRAKVDSARRAIGALNREVAVSAIRQRADAALLDRYVAAADVVLDCGDNFATRQALNAACVRHGKPLVSGAAMRFDGQVAVFDRRQPEAPCYACIFPPAQAVADEPCAVMGVLAPLVGLIGSLQAAEAIKLLCGIGQTLSGRMLMVDLRAAEFTTLRVARDPRCPVCGESGAAHRQKPGRGMGFSPE